MNKRGKLALIAGMAIMAMALTSQGAMSLYDLKEQGGTLTVDDKTFSDFKWSASGLTAFDAHDIMVTAYKDKYGIYYLMWTGNMYLNSSGQASGKLELDYNVTTSPGFAISKIDQYYTGSSSGGALTIYEEVKALKPNGELYTIANSTLGPGDLSDPLAEPGDDLAVLPPQHFLSVKKTLLFEVGQSGGSLTASIVRQSFHQVPVPEPTTVIAGALLLLPFGASTVRFLFNNKKV